MRHVTELLVPGFGRLVLLGPSKLPRARRIAAYIRTRWIQSVSKPKFECGCCEMLVYRVCVVRQNLHVFSLYHNPDLDDRIFDCSLTSMDAVKAEDVRASFRFVGDLNGHHRVVGFYDTNRDGVAAFDFATLSGCYHEVGCRPDPCTWWNN